MAINMDIQWKRIPLDMPVFERWFCESRNGVQQLLLDGSERRVEEW